MEINDENSAENFTISPLPPWWKGQHEVWVEPVAEDWSLLAVHAQQFSNGPIGTVLLPTQGTPAGWSATMNSSTSFKRAVARAIQSCDRQSIRTWP